MGKNTDEHQANERKQWRVDVLALANKELAFQNEEKDKRAEELVLANEEKDKRAEELVYANEEKDKRAQELILANQEKDQRAKELIIANQELAFQNEEKDKRAEELVLANEEKDKRAEELLHANEEKDKRAEELILANKEKDKRAQELIIANQELAFQNREKDKRAEELALANKELAFQNEEKDKRAGELILAREDKEQRADELVIANAELAFQNKEKDKRAAELALANEEKSKTARELILAKEEKNRWAQELALVNEELVYQNELTKFVDTANAPIFGIDAQGKVNEWNQQSEQITGFTKKEVMGQDLVANFIAGDYKTSVAEVLAKALKGDETANYEFPLFTQSGARVDVLLNSTTRRDASGKIVGVIGVGQDITELNKVRVEQASIAKELTQFIDTANAPIFGIDAQGKVNEWNQQSEQITGFTKREVMGQDLVANFIADDYKISVGEVLAKALKGEETANYEFPLFTQSGARVDVLLNSTTRRDASGIIVGVVGVGQDITELNKVRVEQASIANELTQFVDTANAPIFGIDARGRVNEWNQQSEQITGFTKQEVMGQDLVANFIADDYKVSVAEVLAKALKGEETANYEFPLFTQTGDRVDVLLNSTTRRDASGLIVGVVGVGQDITELNKVRVEQASIAKELTQFIDTANAPIFGIDAQGKVNEWNQQSEQITGFTKQEVMGQDLVANFIADDYRIAVADVLAKALQGHQTANYEFPLFTQSGARVDVLLNSTTRRDASGIIVGVVGVGQDITELNKVRVEQASIANELTQFVDTANAPIFGIDARGRVNEWNQQSEQITGFTKHEVMGQDLVANFIADDYKVSVAEVLAKALKGEETANYEFPLFTQTGDRVDVLLNSTTRRDASGLIVGVVGVGQDITELNKVRVEQASIAKELTQFIDTANAPIFGIDAQGKVNEWNQQSELITGFTKREVMGQDLVANFIADDYKVSVEEVLAKALNGEETANYEFPLFTQSGARVDVLLNSTTRRDASGIIAGVVGVGQNITELNKVRVEQEKERKEASAQIIHASKLATLGEMATSVAHELNQPLNVIRMAAGNSRRRMAKGTADTDYLTDKLERIEGQTARAAAIIEHMRMFGRKAKEHPEAVDPRAVVTNALDLMGEQLRLAGIEIVTDFLEDCPFVLGHPIQMEQVILNLLTNASDAMAGRPGAARITLGVFEDEGSVRITSEDTGGGIREDVISRIFEPFYTTKDMGKGTGLGLSVSYGIVRDMDGSIIAENIQGGARFTITLPVIK